MERGNKWQYMYNKWRHAHIHPVASAAIHSEAVFLLLFIPIICGGFVLDTCFVMQYFVSFIILQSSLWGRESCLCYFCCVLNAMSLLSFSLCHWLVCSMWLWHFRIIITYFFAKVDSKSINKDSEDCFNFWNEYDIYFIDWSEKCIPRKLRILYTFFCVEGWDKYHIYISFSLYMYICTILKHSRLICNMISYMVAPEVIFMMTLHSIVYLSSKTETTGFRQVY